jgi:integrase
MICIHEGQLFNKSQWSKKTYNNAISVVRCAFDYGPFTIQEAEELISRLHADWGEAIGNYDEFRFFTGLRPSEQIALLMTDYDARRAVLSVTKARVSCGGIKTAPRRRRTATLRAHARWRF